MSVDYRLLHHFRVSQRRETASRGELAALRAEEGNPETSRVERRTEDVKPSAARTRVPATPPPVLTHLLNEDR